jgi:hypothetical protein
VTMNIPRAFHVKGCMLECGQTETDKRETGSRRDSRRRWLDHDTTRMASVPWIWQMAMNGMHDDMAALLLVTGMH